MDSTKKIKIIIGIVTLFYGIFGIFYYNYFQLDYIGLFFGIILLIIGMLLILSRIIIKTPIFDPREDTRVEFDDWLVIAWILGPLTLVIYLVGPI
ncbi:MAG: hypothetical protein ACTSVY_01890, partial [Candidatus Helarchaeota archaeon]